MTSALTTTGAGTSQSTRIEQARATAEVLAAMEAAKRWPRDETVCEEKMGRACSRPLVADRAFWAFPRAGEQLTGSTIHLAVTLAGIWGNMQYGVMELERRTRESEMLAVAWELESNTRAMTTFIVPHAQDTKRGLRQLTDMRDVYENNANLGARRVREMIFRILPDWYTETAQDICRATLEKSDKPIGQQRDAIVKAFASFDVTVPQLEAKVGRAWGETTPSDLAILRIVGKSIRRGEATVREQFPTPGEPSPTVDPPQVTKEELTGAAPAAEGTSPMAEPEQVKATDSPERKRMNRLFGLLDKADVGDRHQYATGVLKRDVTTFSTLTADEVEVLIANLEAITSEESGE